MRIEGEHGSEQDHVEERALEPAWAAVRADPVNALARRVRLVQGDQGGKHQADQQPAPGGFDTG